MAPGGGHNGTEGWGQYLQYSLDASRLVVNNSAYAGRSARTFTREGRFQAIFDKVQPRDWAIIEFGHNDGRECMFMTAKRNGSLLLIRKIPYYI
jgi:rhamnogalacturonan acetylesterase